MVLKTIKKTNNNANEFVEYIIPFKFARQLGRVFRKNTVVILVYSGSLFFVFV